MKARTARGTNGTSRGGAARVSGSTSSLSASTASAADTRTDALRGPGRCAPTPPAGECAHHLPRRALLHRRRADVWRPRTHAARYLPGAWQPVWERAESLNTQSLEHGDAMVHRHDSDLLRGGWATDTQGRPLPGNARQALQQAEVRRDANNVQRRSEVQSLIARTTGRRQDERDDDESTWIRGRLITTIVAWARRNSHLATEYGHSGVGHRGLRKA
jgi:hypothetical protein